MRRSCLLLACVAGSSCSGWDAAPLRERGASRAAQWVPPAPTEVGAYYSPSGDVDRRPVFYLRDLGTGEQSVSFGGERGRSLVRITADGVELDEDYRPDPTTRRLWESIRESLAAQRSRRREGSK